MSRIGGEPADRNTPVSASLVVRPRWESEHVRDRWKAEDFVGRDAELAAIGRLVDEARRGLPSLLLVGGDAGIGKSTLLTQAAEQAEIALLLGHGIHVGGNAIPLAPLGDLLRQVRRSWPALTESPHFETLAGSLSSAPLTTAGVDNPVGVFVPLLELLTEVAGDDALIVGIEDLHWADTATWDLFEFLARNLVNEQVVLVGTYRANEVGVDQSQRRRVAELARLPNAHRIHLGGLSRDQVARRVAALTGAVLASDVVDEIVERGEGNPFFTEELVAAYLSGERIPTLLSDLISTDLARVGDGERLVLGVIATISRDAGHDLVAAAAELTDGEVESAVHAAIDAQLVVIDPQTDTYRFRHALIGEVVYTELLPSERRRLHLRVARVLQARPPGGFASASAAGELAFHLDRAGETADAFTALLAAADAAEAVAPGVAFRHLERALEIWDEAGAVASALPRADRLMQAADLATGAVSNQRGVELARDALRFGPPTRGWPWAHERLGRFLWGAGHLAESKYEFERAAELIDSGEEVPATAVCAGLAQAELMHGNYELAASWCRRVFEVAPTPEHDPVAWVIARRVLGIVHCSAGDPDQGVTLAREAVTAAPTAMTNALASIYLSIALVDAGRYEEAAVAALEGVADDKVTGLGPTFQSYPVGIAAEALIRLGRFESAGRVLGEHHDANNLPVGTLRLARSAALLAARRGSRAAAISFVASVESRPTDGFHQAVVTATSAEVHLAIGNWELAGAAAERGWETYRTTPIWAARFAMFSVAAAVERALDAQARREPVDPGIAVALGDRICQVTSILGDTALAGDSAAHLAHAAATVTRLGGADPESWARAGALWRDLSDPWWEAVARVREAEAAVSTGDQARGSAALQDAQRLASGLGAEIVLAEIAAVSRRTRLSLETPDPIAVDRAATNGLGLTPREAEVLARVAVGRTNRQIGDELYISEKTASVHVSNIIRKLGVTTRVDAAAIAQRLGKA